MQATRRFYQRKDGAVFSGLCNGIAHYVGINPTFVRVWWLGMSFFIGAKIVLVYAVLMFLAPYAKDEGRSTALIDTETLKHHIVKGDAKGLRRYFAELWANTLRKFDVRNIRAQHN
jgi:phage shock protein PspC (stress-responsive transcriptional regulator)